MECTEGLLWVNDQAWARAKRGQNCLIVRDGDRIDMVLFRLLICSIQVLKGASIISSWSWLSPRLISHREKHFRERELVEFTSCLPQPLNNDREPVNKFVLVFGRHLLIQVLQGSRMANKQNLYYLRYNS